MLNRLFVLAVASMVAVAWGGCRSVGASNAPAGRVTVTETGAVYVGETRTELAGMAAKLKANGCTPQSRITVEIPRIASPEAIQAIGTHLTLGGFRSFIFIKPRQAVSIVGEDPAVNRFRVTRPQR